MSRRALQIVLGVAGAVALAIGGVTLMGVHDPAYAASGLPSDRPLDSNLRFFGGLWLGLALTLCWLVPRVERETTLLRVLCLMVFIGGLGRVVSMLVLGLPPLPFVGFTVLELVGAPALAVWQARLCRRGSEAIAPSAAGR